MKAPVMTHEAISMPHVDASTRSFFVSCVDFAWAFFALEAIFLGVSVFKFFISL